MSHAQNFNVALGLIKLLDIRGEVTDEFSPFSNRKFIILRKRTVGPFLINIKREFGHIVPDFVFGKFGEKYHVGERTDAKPAMSVLIDEPEIISKEKAEDWVASLLENGYEIITNPCLSHSDTLFYMNKGILQRA